jgi:lipoprotein signal peptidase
VFNVADMAVVIGALLLAFSFLRAPVTTGSAPSDG